MLTWHNDVGRTGQNLNETILVPSKVNAKTFGKVFAYAVDGQIFGQPLYIYNVTIPGKGTYNVVYVATENDGVYAFDADGINTTALWQDSFINPGNGITPIPCADTGANPCPFSSVIGITGTPVVDPSTGTLYVVAATKENGDYFQRLHALDITTGAEKFGGPVVIEATVKGSGDGSHNGMVQFTPLHHNQRPGLLLVNGVVYIAWASFGDVAPFHGWVLGYDAATLKLGSAFVSTPNGSDGGVWQSGGGLSADSDNNLYLLSGNGTFDIPKNGVDYGDTFLKLDTNLQVLDYFTPHNQEHLSKGDLDLGSGAALILPLQSGSHSKEALSAGKQGLIYLVDRTKMGKFHSKTDNVVEIVQGAKGGYRASPAYWNNKIYYSGWQESVIQYSISKGKMSTKPVHQGPTKFVWGSTPAISANGKTNGILWAIERPPKVNGVFPPSILHAYNAANVSKEIYNSAQSGSRDTPGSGITFSVPTILNGRVYIGSGTELDVYGFLP
jgi:hypothetical protein